MPPTAKKNKPRIISVDFSNVEERRAGKKGVRVAEGDYLLSAKDYEVKSKKDDKSRKYINWEMYVEKPSSLKGKGPIYHVSSLVPENLWSLRNLLEDMGIKVKKAAVDLPLEKVLGRPFGATLEDDEYTNDEGKTTVKSKIAATFPAAEYTDAGVATTTDDDEEEEDEDEEDEDEVSKAATTDDDDDLEELDVDDI